MVKSGTCGSLRLLLETIDYGIAVAAAVDWLAGYVGNFERFFVLLGIFFCVFDFSH